MRARLTRRHGRGLDPFAARARPANSRARLHEAYRQVVTRSTDNNLGNFRQVKRETNMIPQYDKYALRGGPTITPSAAYDFCVLAEAMT